MLPSGSVVDIVFPSIVILSIRILSILLLASVMIALDGCSLPSG